MANLFCYLILKKFDWTRIEIKPQNTVELQAI